MTTDDDFDFTFRDGGLDAPYSDSLTIEFSDSSDVKKIIKVLNKIKITPRPGKAYAARQAKEWLKELKEAVLDSMNYHRGGNYSMSWTRHPGPDFSYSI
jgi:hypothetical protein